MSDKPEHRFRNRLNQLMLQAMSIKDHSETDADYLRQMEKVEALQLTLQNLSEDLKLQVDPDWLESRVRVLVVEDDDLQRNAIVQTLRAAGLFVAEAGDGVAAINYLHNAAQPDVVLMDVQMPDCDGIEAKRMIQHIPMCGTVKVIAVTALNIGEVDLTSFDGFLRKPFQPSQLIEAIRVAVTSDDSTCGESAKEAWQE